MISISKYLRILSGEESYIYIYEELTDNNYFFSRNLLFFFFTGSINRSILVKVKKGDGDGARDQSPEGGEAIPITNKSIKQNTRETIMGFSPTDN